MDIGPTLVADAESAELMEPTQRPFDHPACFAQTAAMGLADLGQHIFDAKALKEEAVGLTAIGAVALNRIGTPPRAPHLSPHPVDGSQHGNELGAVVDVGSSQGEGERDALGIGEKVMLAARFAAVGRVRPRLGPPKTARTELESATARDQSIRSAAWSRARSSWWRRSHTPSFCQSRSRRQQVMPQPQPISKGKSLQPIPLLSTKRMPVSAARLEIGLRPGYRSRRGFSGKSGSIIFHNVSSTNGFAITSICPIQSALYSHFVTRS